MTFQEQPETHQGVGGGEEKTRGVRARTHIMGGEGGGEECGGVTSVCNKDSKKT